MNKTDTIIKNHNKRLNRQKIFVGLVFGSIITVSNAQENIPTKTALAFNHSTHLYKGTSSKNKVVPLIFFNYKDFYIDGLALGYKLLAYKNLETSFELSSDFLGYENSDSIYLSTLSDKKSTLNVVLKNEYLISQNIKLISKLHYDVSNKHKSYSFDIGTQYNILQQNNHNLTSSISFEYMNQKKSDYYYGVSSTQTNQYLYPYKAKYALNTTIGLKYLYTYNAKWSYFSDFKTTFFDSTITNSPIVEKNYQNNLTLGVLYVW
jgi:outer membrane protein